MLHEDKWSKLQEIIFLKMKKPSIKFNKNGELSLLETIGGLKGILENIIPGSIFFATYLATHNLSYALFSSIIAIFIFFIVRCIKKMPPMRGIYGITSVFICALYASYTKEASSFYVPGFYTNSIFFLITIFSIIFKWPIVGIIFGYILNEDTQWRQNIKRYKMYVKCTLIYSSLFAIRLAVQLPLYFAGEEYVDYLGFARITMGIPLYILSIWIIWNIIRSSEPIYTTTKK